ncbi:MAG TPA: FAD-dependent oxidoreductase [Acidimicrobiales bacterium]|nr:FAD-dependent oxidoreductase [Acidimicrobiales bacterium]
MAQKRTFVIVGASLAGAKAAETLRTEGFDGKVVLIGEEPTRPYERPPLSKEYLRGEKGFDFAAVHSTGYYDDAGIELRTSTRARALDVRESEVVLDNGERLGFDRLLLATGSVPRKLAIDGADLEGIFYLRTVENADALRDVLASRGRLVVIGGGWVGCEVAASARQLGAEVALVELSTVPLEHALGLQVGSVFRDLHTEHGVELHLGAGVTRLAGSAAPSGTGARSRSVRAVELDDGTALEADAVLVAVGVAPRTELAAGAGLALGSGVAVDEHLSTSAPSIYAAGDVASAFYPHLGARIRLEHWSAALNQGPAAARAMLGQDITYDRTPYFFSDQYDLGMEYRGWAPSHDRVVLRGDPASRKFLAFWLSQGRVVAAMNSNIWDAGDKLEALVRTRQIVDPDGLADTSTDLSDLVTSEP